MLKFEALLQVAVNRAAQAALDSPCIAVMSTLFYRVLDANRCGDLKAVYSNDCHYSSRSDLLTTLSDVDILLFPVHLPFEDSADEGHFVRCSSSYLHLHAMC